MNMRWGKAGLEVGKSLGLETWMAGQQTGLEAQVVVGAEVGPQFLAVAGDCCSLGSPARGTGFVGERTSFGFG